MTPSEAEGLLRRLVESRSARTVSELLDTMIAFYRDQRADGPILDDDGDMLLYQWGTYDWGNGKRFEIDLTRQFILPGDDEPYQLHLTMRFAPGAATDVLGASNHWCHAPDGLASFESVIRQSAPYIKCQAQSPAEVEISYDQC